MSQWSNWVDHKSSRIIFVLLAESNPHNSRNEWKHPENQWKCAEDRRTVIYRFVPMLLGKVNDSWDSTEGYYMWRYLFQKRNKSFLCFGGRINLSVSVGLATWKAVENCRIFISRLNWNSKHLGFLSSSWRYLFDFVQLSVLFLYSIFFLFYL